MFLTFLLIFVYLSAPEKFQLRYSLLNSAQGELPPNISSHTTLLYSWVCLNCRFRLYFYILLSTQVCECSFLDVSPHATARAESVTQLQSIQIDSNCNGFVSSLQFVPRYTYRLCWTTLRVQKYVDIRPLYYYTITRPTTNTWPILYTFPWKSSKNLFIQVFMSSFMSLNRFTT